jgi:hypothetical protein
MQQLLSFCFCLVPRCFGLLQSCHQAFLARLFLHFECFNVPPYSLAPSLKFCHCDRCLEQFVLRIRSKHVYHVAFKPAGLYCARMEHIDGIQQRSLHALLAFHRLGSRSPPPLSVGFAMLVCLFHIADPEVETGHTLQPAGAEAAERGSRLLPESLPPEDRRFGFGFFNEN